MSFNNLYKSLIILLCIFLLIPVLFIPSFSSNISNNNSNNSIENTRPSYSFELSDNGLVWPTPGYTKINSYFGRRSSPTKFASSFHLGIDIRCSRW